MYSIPHNYDTLRAHIAIPLYLMVPQRRKNEKQFKENGGKGQNAANHDDGDRAHIHGLGWDLSWNLIDADRRIDGL